MSSLDWFNAKIDDPEDIQGAYAFCQRLAARQYKNYPVATRMMAKPLRRHVAVLYAFTRMADDFADRAEFEGSREERLEEWRSQLWASGEQPPRHPIFLAMRRTVEEFELPREPFDDLVSSFVQDCQKPRFKTYEEVLDYCRRSANPVGRVILMIHGYRDPERLELSDKICTALRLTSLLQNLSRNLEKDRIYIPEEDFQRFSYSEADLRMGVVNERYRSMMKNQWKKARALFEEGKPLAGKLSWPLSWELKLTWKGGNEILRKIQRIGFDTLHRRPRLERTDWPRLVTGVLLW